MLGNDPPRERCCEDPRERQTRYHFRGAWIFSEIKSYLETGVAAPAPSTDERIEVALRHARMLSERFDDHIVKMRKHAMWYLKGMRGATAARRAINDAVTFNDFATIFHDVAVLQKSGEEQA